MKFVLIAVTFALGMGGIIGSPTGVADTATVKRAARTNNTAAVGSLVCTITGNNVNYRTCPSTTCTSVGQLAKGSVRIFLFL
jgi:hypothetical protein